MEEITFIRGAGFAFLGVFAGMLSGLLGIGGAVIMIPALVMVFGFSQRLAQGTTLALMIPPIGLLAAIQYWKAGDIDLRVAIIIAVFFFVGGYLGGKLAISLDPVLLRRIFAVILVLIAIKMFFE